MSMVMGGLCLFLPVFLLGGCDRVSMLSFNVGLEADVRSLLGQHGIHLARLACRQSGRTRAGTCAVGLTPEQADRLRSTLGLNEASDADGQRLQRFLAHAGGGGCRSDGHPLAGGWSVWYAAGRPKQLQLDSGSAFEYLVFYYGPEEGSGCLDLAYAYG